ncbi:hypothetical protein CANARDRAFT_6068 [[Candida] arabinofermentans NRRL YB-2248]|uniref:Uncharacterized protein n=1 Tax=[Candida] arabinofermentans NRRL YB-2248 TaxID=983967 RepID=A0A1E4T705_9ASCO|nr:hypothetical protein CANARDRAFT_6068 [[Candida] arabinofermentans NRRL YB-2248]
MSHEDRIVIILKPLNGDFVNGYLGLQQNVGSVTSPPLIEAVVEIRSLFTNYQFTNPVIKIGSTVEQRYCVAKGSKKLRYHATGKETYTGLQEKKEVVQCHEIYRHQGAPNPLVGMNLEFCMSTDSMLHTHYEQISKTGGYVSTRNFIIVEFQYMLSGLPDRHPDLNKVFTKRSYFEIPISYYNHTPLNYIENQVSAKISDDNINILVRGNKPVILQNDGVVVQCDISPGLQLNKQRSSKLRLLNIDTRLRQIISFTGIAEQSIITDMAITRKDVDEPLEQSNMSISSNLTMPDVSRDVRIIPSETLDAKTVVDVHGKRGIQGIPFMNQNLQTYDYSEHTSIYRIKYEIYTRFEFGKDKSHVSFQRSVRVPIDISYLDANNALQLTNKITNTNTRQKRSAYKTRFYGPKRQIDASTTTSIFQIEI